MASLSAVRDGVKATLASAITDLHVYDTVPERPNLPAVIVQPVSADFTVAMGRGTDTWEFDLSVLVSAGDIGVGQDALDGYVSGAGARSVRQAVFNARTLGLADTDAHVARMDRYGMQFEAAGVDHVGATLRLIVHTKGTA